jgi:two-component system CheB/CheR fusion protein
MNNESSPPLMPADPDAAPSSTASIVVVGGSAGGLEALTEILDQLPDGLGMALIYVSHQASRRDVLAAHTRMQVVVVTEVTPIDPDHVYLPAPGMQLVVTRQRLVPLPRPDDHAQHTPIDTFMTSLARMCQQRAIGVLLSGGGSDGANGVREIRAAGGIVIVQDPDTARHEDMPRAAIATGVVDLVLAPNKIAAELRRIGRHPSMRGAPPRRSTDELPIRPDQLQRLFTMLRDASGVDFTHHKPTTLRRRLQRRLVLHGLETVEQYIRYMREQPDELGKLYQDLLSHVARFFRDPESFTALTTEVFPKFVQQRRGPDPIRIWLPGCSTGEEAYSVVIALLEFLGDDASGVPVQIFATDVSETAIERARKGMYPESIAADLTPERLRRFFTTADGKYRIAKVVRDRVVFARQDVTRDPPFSKLDLILCRNVLVYLGAALQLKLMTVFHYALKPSGFLMLGGGETVGAPDDLFTVIDRQLRIFGKRSSAPNDERPPEHGPGRLPSRGPPAPTEARPAGDLSNLSNLSTLSNLSVLADRAVLDRYGPPGVIVDEELRIVQFRGKTGAYLELPPGDTTQRLDLRKMARDGLSHGLQTALDGARRSGGPVRQDGLRVTSDGLAREVDLQVIPLAVPGERRHYLVLFEDVPASVSPVGSGAVPVDERVRQLQEELAVGREYMQSIIEDLETAHEELQSAHEELLSSNEELQSTNEELHTAKEELQSTNDALCAANEELSGRNEVLARVNGDLVNLLGGVEIAIVLVGADLAIRRFTPMAGKVLNLIPTDVGRPIGEIKPDIDCPGLEQLIARVIGTVTIQEMNVRDGEGNGYVLRIRPYRDVEDRVDGAVLALFDVAEPLSGRGREPRS